jgi:hypothetical protein
LERSEQASVHDGKIGLSVAPAEDLENAFNTVDPRVLSLCRRRASVCAWSDESPRGSDAGSRLPGRATTRAAHTNQYACNHVLEEEMKLSAALAAYIIDELAVRDDKVPRKPLPVH